VASSRSCEFRYFNHFQIVLFCRTGHSGRNPKPVARFRDSNRESLPRLTRST